MVLDALDIALVCCISGALSSTDSMLSSSSISSRARASITQLRLSLSSKAAQPLGLGQSRDFPISRKQVCPPLHNPTPAFLDLLPPFAPGWETTPTFLLPGPLPPSFPLPPTVQFLSFKPPPPDTASSCLVTRCEPKTSLLRRRETSITADTRSQDPQRRLARHPHRGF